MNNFAYRENAVSKSIQSAVHSAVRLAAATALLGLALGGSAQANFGGPYAYAGVANVDDLNTLVDEMTFGWPTGTIQLHNTWAQTEMGVHRAVAIGDEGPTRYGAVSAWSDEFTVSGGSGGGTAQVSLSLTGLFGAGDYASASYFLFKTADPLLPLDMLDYLNGAPVPAGIEVVMWSEGSSLHDAGPVDTVLTGSFNYGYDTPFYLTSVAGLMASGVGRAEFGDTATFGISAGTGTLATASGTAYLAAAVPEAHEWTLILVGLGLLGLQIRRKNRTHTIAP